MGPRRPNVLVVFTDQQRWDTVGCYGSPMGLTPNLDAMAGRGTLMEHAFTCQPVCAPARASLQTGLFATATGVWRNGLALRPGVTALAECFNRAGYRTGYIGKWHLAGTRGEPVPEELRGGYRYWLASDVLEWTSHPYEGHLFDGDNRPIEFKKYRVDALTDYALEFLCESACEPFFLMVSYLEPHFQNDMKRFVAPEGYAARYAHCYVPEDLRGHEGDWREELPDYYGMVARIDENLGRLLAELERLGVSQGTIVLFLSDHGCHFRTRNAEYKRSCHESSIRIPMVFDGPGFRAGRVFRPLASLVDVPPTLLAACGLRAPGKMQGRNLVPLLDAPDIQPDEVFIQISESEVARAVRTPRWKYSAVAPGKGGSGESGSDRYVDECLYDLSADPFEQHNLVGVSAYTDVLTELRRRLASRMVDAGEPQPVIGPPSA